MQNLNVYMSGSGSDSVVSVIDEIITEMIYMDSKNTIVKVKVSPKMDLSKKENYDTLVELSLHLKAIGYNSAIVLNAKESILTGDEINNLVNLEEDIGKNDVIMLIEDVWYDEYSLMDLLLADEKIRNFVNDLKAQKLSPFENYLMIYDFLTQRVYKRNENDYNCQDHTARDVISVMNGDYIVCVGYARVMERLCNEMGIRCESQSCEVFDKKGNPSGGHRNNSVYLEDEKYGIKGWYYADSCWDSVKKGKEYKKTYNYCLVPISDKDKLKDDVIKIRKGEKMFYLYNSDQYGFDNGNSFHSTGKTSVLQNNLSNKQQSEYSEIRDCQQKSIEKIFGEVSSDPIPLEAFEKALKVVFRTQGLPEKEIDFQVKTVLERTIAASEKDFSTDAQNCFSVEALARRQKVSEL